MDETDLDRTGEHYAALPHGPYLRRKDDLEKLRFRKATAQYSMANITAITAVMLWRDGDIGQNITTILVWIVVGHVVVIGTVMGVKMREVIEQVRASKP